VSNPSKAKGTAGETELLRAFELAGFPAMRTAPSQTHDITLVGDHTDPLDVLATRPDRGEWLLTVRLEDFVNLYRDSTRQAHVEVKRHARFAHHAIFTSKFGRL